MLTESRRSPGEFHSQAQRWCDWVAASCSCVVPSG